MRLHRGIFIFNRGVFMEEIYKAQKNAREPLYCCWHANNLYVAVSKDAPYYFVRFEECDRSNRGWSYLHLLSYSEGLIGTKKVHKLVVRNANDENATPFLIIATKMTRGSFNPKPDNE